MSQPQWNQVTQQKVTLCGALDRETVPQLWREIKEWKPEDEHVELALKDVERVDSSGMVMLIHLIEHAKKLNCHIMLSFVPKQLSTLFQLSNIESLVAKHIQHKQG